MRVTTDQLAKLLHEEFQRDGWGDVDQYLFEMVASGDYAGEADDLRQVLERVAARLNSTEDDTCIHMKGAIGSCPRCEGT